MKIMLVEDDKALSEIYGIRLSAEGYDVVTAGDGEEALAKVMQEKPDLIIADVMMPKISGFDMLDIIRSTDGIKDTKVIVMTALSADSQRERGEALGADRYLVKSQVGIEDVINVVHEVLGDKQGSVIPEASTGEAVALVGDAAQEMPQQPIVQGGEVQQPAPQAMPQQPVQQGVGETFSVREADQRGGIGPVPPRI